MQFAGIEVSKWKGEMGEEGRKERGEGEGSREYLLLVLGIRLVRRGQRYNVFDRIQKGEVISCKLCKLACRVCLVRRVTVITFSNQGVRPGLRKRSKGANLPRKIFAENFIC
jgi:hypothetical protein